MSKKVHMFSAKIETNLQISKALCIENPNILASVSEICDWKGAKGCKSDRSRQEFSNESLVAQIGVGTAENEPLKFHSSFKL